MKIAIIGAGGVRTPLILQSMFHHQQGLGMTELTLMDIDSERLELIGALTAQMEKSPELHFNLLRTIDARQALQGADFVITTFRVGGHESRVIDERVPLSLEILGQETTGPGGFAMGMRSIPVLQNYIHLMADVCPNAWLINFANPAGMLVEAVVGLTGWQRSVGICDAPSYMWRVAAAVLGASEEDIYLDYFGLNHLGWVKAVKYQGRDHLPDLIRLLQAAGGIPGLPFEPGFIANLGIIPNEYLFYYYNNKQAVRNILQAGQTRGEQIAALNQALFKELRRGYALHDSEMMNIAYQAYLKERAGSYMVHETGKGHPSDKSDPIMLDAISGEGYAGVALNLIKALVGKHPRVMVLNIPNRGAIPAMGAEDVVEIPAFVSRDLIRPMAVGDIPDHCLGLIKQVKAYEHLTIAAAAEDSYSKALQALALHPLVPDYTTAKTILDEYLVQHRDLFPSLK